MGLIRLLLALSIVAAHSGAIFGSRFVGGQIAVQSFYIISGFYMSLILNEKYIGKNNSFRLFITNRFFKLFPVYWAVLLGTIFFCLCAVILTQGRYFPEFNNYLSVKTNPISLIFLVATNILIFGQDIVMFLGIIPESGDLYFTSNFANSTAPLYPFLFVPQAWTLGLELTFYLIAPYILKRGYKIVIALITVSFLLRLFIYNILDWQNDPWTYRFFPTEIMFFLFGYLSYRINLKIKTISVPKIISLLTLVFMVAFTALYQFLPSTKINYLLFSPAEAIYFLLIILSVPVLFNFMKNNRLDNQIGELSYPVYISHILVIGVFYITPFAFLKSGWFTAAITLGAAYLLNKTISVPIENYRQSRLQKTGE